MSKFPHLKNAVGFALLSLAIQANAQLKVGVQPRVVANHLYFEVQSDNNSRFSVDKANGRVGIGTATPAAKLHVVGDVIIQDGNQATNKVLTSDANGKASWQSASASSCQYYYLPTTSIQYPDTATRFITSSSWANDPFGIGHSRPWLNSPQGWSAGANDATQWAGIDFGVSTEVKAIQTQGRKDADQWLTSYTVQKSDDGSTWTTIGAFSANNNRNTVVTNTLPAGTKARFIRLSSLNFSGHMSARMAFQTNRGEIYTKIPNSSNYVSTATGVENTAAGLTALGGSACN